MKTMLFGAPNARDLGGLKTADGRVLKSGRLIRSGMLGKLTDGDIEILKSMNLKTVVDFRTTQEYIEKPDIKIEGVRYISCPIIEGKTEGITHEKPESEDEEAIRTVKMAGRMMARQLSGTEQMEMLYNMLVTMPHAIEHYRSFFELLLQHEEGALLYHCMMGKDRVGVATALILSALGVPRGDIVENYMITKERCAPGTEKLIANCRKFTASEDVLEFIRELDTSEESFINSAFSAIDEHSGGMDNFLREKMCLGDAKIERLKALYLE